MKVTVKEYKLRIHKLIDFKLSTMKAKQETHYLCQKMAQIFLVNGAMSDSISLSCSVPHYFTLGTIFVISYMDHITSVFYRPQVN